MATAVGLPMKRREGAPDTYSVPLKRRVPKIEEIKVEGVFNPEPALAISDPPIAVSFSTLSPKSPFAGNPVRFKLSNGPLLKSRPASSTETQFNYPRSNTNDLVQWNRQRDCLGL
jgi:hypothetical protein